MNTKSIKRKPRSKGIAETYIYIEVVPRGLNASKVQEYLEKNAYTWAERRFKSSVSVRVSVEVGSLKVKVLVGGIAIFNLVAGYGSFRSGIDHLVQDAKAFSEQVIERLEIDENIPNEAIKRTEKRLGVPGKIQRFFRSIDKLNSPEISRNERLQLTEKLKEEFLNIIILLESNEDRELFIEEVPLSIKPMPNEPLPPPIIGVINITRAREDE